MSEATNLYAVKNVIRIIRHQRVKRTAKRYPARVVGPFTVQASAYRRSNIAALNPYLSDNEQVIYSRSQFVTLNSQHINNQDVASFDPENIGQHRHIPGEIR
jgi:hypothetical protein